MAGKIGSRNAPMPKNCSMRSEMSAPTTPIQLRAARAPVSTEALFSEGSSGEYDASARKRRSAETHNRNPTSSFSRRLPVGANMLARKRMWAVVPTDKNHPVAQIGQSLIIMPRSGSGGNGGSWVGVYSWLPGGAVTRTFDMGFTGSAILLTGGVWGHRWGGC